MRITIVYRYFWPDTAPYALLLEQMIPWFVEEGHEINVYAAQPAYRTCSSGGQSLKSESVFGARVKRVSLLSERERSIIKTINMVLFSIKGMFSLLFGAKQDIFWVGTTPPIFQSFCILLAAKLRGTKLVYQMQDIHPEIAIKAGIMKPSLLTRLLAWLDNITLRNASVVTVLSADMKAVVLERTNNTANVVVINNFALGVNESARNQEKKDGPIRFSYAGNIGQFQNLNAFVEAFELISPKDATLEFIGDGKARGELEHYCKSKKLSNVSFHGQKSSTEAFEFLLGCDVGLISLSPNLYKFAYPTKMHTYLAANLRLFAMIENESALARVVQENSLGVSLPWSASKQEISNEIKSLISQAKKDRGTFTVPKHIWHSDGAKEKWLELFAELNELNQGKHNG